MNDQYDITPWVARFVMGAALGGVFMIHWLEPWWLRAVS